MSTVFRLTLSRASSSAHNFARVRHASRASISAAVCLERYPKVLPPPTAFEREYEAFAKRVQVEKSAVSLEEYLALTRDLEDNKPTKGKGKGKGSDAMPIAVKDDDMRMSSQAPLLPGITTQADVENNRKSLNRRLADKLLLLVKDASGEWRLPSTAYAEAQDAGLRQTAERALLEASASAMPDAYFFGNHPSCCMTLDNNEKVFIYRSMLVSGDITTGPSVTDHAWVAFDELEQYLSGPRLDALRRFVA